MDLTCCDTRTLGQRQEDRPPHPRILAVRHREVAVVAREPPDRDEVAREVQAALRPEDDVMQRRVLDEHPADSTARCIAFDHMLAHMARHQTEALEL